MPARACGTMRTDLNRTMSATTATAPNTISAAEGPEDASGTGNDIESPFGFCFD
jgi:hypothetical protein